MQKNPAVVLSPEPNLLWLQAYPHGYPSKPSPSVHMPASAHKQKINAHPFQIPKAWFAEGGKRQVKTATAKRNPWQCKPTTLLCGKKGTDYWACKKNGQKGGSH
ncbi:hypothetical protein [Acidithiobacillus marinus]|uniref:hypothetical protein n=1 Tax=Acidithiobacillus marinus TaxID=187490 RepID=UPI00117BA946|nr:hypothetical protein [Acidithiobacillus marinus]